MVGWSQLALKSFNTRTPRSTETVNAEPGQHAALHEASSHGCEYVVIPRRWDNRRAEQQYALLSRIVKQRSTTACSKPHQRYQPQAEPSQSQSNDIKRYVVLWYVRSIIAILPMAPKAGKHRTQDCALFSPSCVPRNRWSWAQSCDAPRINSWRNLNVVICVVQYYGEKRKRRENAARKNLVLIAAERNCGGYTRLLPDQILVGATTLRHPGTNPPRISHALCHGSLAPPSLIWPTDSCGKLNPDTEIIEGLIPSSPMFLR